MHNLESNSATAAAKQLVSAAPLVQNLNAYPPLGMQVDLGNLVTYPPKIEPVPVKPLFLDVAWNYVEYPGRRPAAVSGPGGPGGGKQAEEKKKETPVVNGVEEKAQAQPEQKKKGWFGFGR